MPLSIFICMPVTQAQYTRPNKEIERILPKDGANEENFHKLCCCQRFLWPMPMANTTHTHTHTHKFSAHFPLTHTPPPQTIPSHKYNISRNFRAKQQQIWFYSVSALVSVSISGRKFLLSNIECRVSSIEQKAKATKYAWNLICFIELISFHFICFDLFPQNTQERKLETGLELRTGPGQGPETGPRPQTPDPDSV